MKSKINSFLFACLAVISIIFSSCVADQNQPEDLQAVPPATSTVTRVPPALTAIPTFTPGWTRTPSSAQVRRASPTPYPTPKPYLIKLVQGGGDGVDEIYHCMAVYAPYPRFALYEDGQLLFYEDGKFWEAFLTRAEIDRLLEQIKETGYFQLGDSLEDHYDLPEGTQYGEGGWGISISVQGKGVYIHPQLEQYLVKPIREVTSILQNYRPREAARPYLPRKMELWAVPMDSGYFSTPEAPVEAPDWPETLPELKKFYIGLSEKETEFLLDADYFSGVPELRLFHQDGITYWVAACLPWIGN